MGGKIIRRKIFVNNFNFDKNTIVTLKISLVFPLYSDFSLTFWTFLNIVTVWFCCALWVVSSWTIKLWMWSFSYEFSRLPTITFFIKKILCDGSKCPPAIVIVNKAKRMRFLITRLYGISKEFAVASCFCFCTIKGTFVFHGYIVWGESDRNWKLSWLLFSDLFYWSVINCGVVRIRWALALLFRLM